MCEHVPLQVVAGEGIPKLSKWGRFRLRASCCKVGIMKALPPPDSHVCTPCPHPPFFFFDPGGGPVSSRADCLPGHEQGLPGTGLSVLQNQNGTLKPITERWVVQLEFSPFWSIMEE